MMKSYFFLTACFQFRQGATNPQNPFLWPPKGYTATGVIYLVQSVGAFWLKCEISANSDSKSNLQFIRCFFLCIKYDIFFLGCHSPKSVFEVLFFAMTQLCVHLLFENDRLLDLDFKLQSSYQLISERGSHGNRFVWNMTSLLRVIRHVCL